MEGGEMQTGSFRSPAMTSASESDPVVLVNTFMLIPEC